MSETNIEKIRIGRIHYWNLYPLYSEIKKRFADRVEFVSGHPSQVNQMLRDGLVDLAPSSSLCLVKDSGNTSVVPFGIAASKSVQSVYWGLTAEHMPIKAYINARIELIRSIFQEAQKRYPDSARDTAKHICSRIRETSFEEKYAVPLALSSASETSNALSRVFYYFFFGKRKYRECIQHGMHIPTQDACSGKAIQLLIGDEALEKRSLFYKTMDLGRLWSEVSGLPFVFAVWQTRQNLDPVFVAQLEELCMVAQRKMRIDASLYLDEIERLGLRTGNIDLKDYWQHIDYKLEDAHIKGLKLFLALTKELLFAKEETDYLIGLPKRDVTRPASYS